MFFLSPPKSYKLAFICFTTYNNIVPLVKFTRLFSKNVKTVQQNISGLFQMHKFALVSPN